ncbi:ninjurin-2-like [Tubulanus polymorphus]|uniref:ninjurin-2-like n=1 Tax=Tubulanus polymorphus TaxID=672921 RepID=UPI003DA45693
MAAEIRAVRMNSSDIELVRRNSNRSHADDNSSPSHTNDVEQYVKNTNSQVSSSPHTSTESAASSKSDPRDETAKLTAEFGFYATKKSKASTMLDLALLSANASLLRVNIGLEKTPMVCGVISLLALSILCQLVVGFIFLRMVRSNAWSKLMVKYDIESETTKQEKLKALYDQIVLNSRATAIVMFITIINVFIAAFGNSVLPNSSNKTIS